MTRHLLLIGGQRCGSTYLRTLLGSAAEIAVAEPATPEPKVFCSAEASARGREWYAATYFGHAEPGQLLLDKSTSYLEDPVAAVRARDMIPDARILAVLRDPVARAVSNWRFSTEHGFEHRPLETALTENLAGPAEWDREATSVSPFAYLERGRYADQLRPWIEAFPDATEVVFLEDLLATPGTLTDLMARLGVAPGQQPSTDPVNHSLGPMPTIAPTLLARLRSHFAAYDADLERLLGRPVPWRSR